MAIHIQHEEANPTPSNDGASVCVRDHPFDLIGFGKPVLVEIACFDFMFGEKISGAKG